MWSLINKIDAVVCLGKVPAKKGSNGIFTGQIRDGENMNTNCMAGSWDCFDHCQQFLNHSKSMKLGHCKYAHVLLYALGFIESY